MRASIVAFGVSALAMVVLIGVLVVAHIALSVCQNLQAASGTTGGIANAVSAPIHVCFVYGDRDLRPLVVAVRSLLAAAAAPERLAVHLITSPDLADWAGKAARIHLPGVRVQIHHNSELQIQIAGLLSGPGSHGMDAFDFAPFYIDEYLASSHVHANRVVYVDTEAVIQGDVAELADMDLHGKAVAAVSDCRQRFQDVVNSETLTQLGLASTFDPSVCVVSLGLLVMDLEKWRRRGITTKIEEWLVKARVAGGSLILRAQWPQAVFLLASGIASATESLRLEAYHKLENAWRCDGLGLPGMSAVEALALKEKGLNDTVMGLLHVSWDEEGVGQPRVTLCSSMAKVLHFSGAAKPWLALEGSRFGLCSSPSSIPKEFWNSAQDIRISSGEITIVSCQELWSAYISADVLAESEEDDAAGIVEADGEDKWDKSHQKFVNNLRKQVDLEQSQNTDAEKEARLKKLLQKLKKKDEELQKRRVIGGFMVGQIVKSMADISVRGQIVVPRGTVGTIQGPSLKNPLMRINVFFKARLDGKFRSVNVLPREIVLVEEE